ncbi:Cytochrome P450 52A13 [Neolecta irregularis DAH-3]|uniref:Cytochrome P450 52A13 n=1 Tax=Neolecta irregularis (strain DAH-3) TaxID=1198029 RepID=A0A1U7LU21_NEOID|nr:Cytochrome P450 52A13 [Neolecta irregularis DAH-3]|eukprot:OLL26170.1 Cytochrome P450 52A13 [Neolecta irregularis DAH-3]
MLLLLFAVAVMLVGLCAHMFSERKGLTSEHLFPPLVKSFIPLGLDNILMLIRLSIENTHFYFFKRHFENYGQTFALRVGVANLYFTNDPENIKALLSTQFGEFGKGPLFHETLKEFLGHGIFNVDHELWQTSRTLLRPQFVKERISDLELFERHFQQLLLHIPNDKTVDLLDLFMRMTLDSATEYLMGVSTNSLADPKVKFAEAFDFVQDLSARRVILGPLYQLYPTFGYSKAIRTLDHFVEPFIDRAIGLHHSNSEKPSSNYIFLDAISELTQDRKVLRDQILNILLAGRDTTAAALSWAFYEMARHEDVWRKLQEEVAILNGAKPTFDDLKSIKYLQWIINETLRLYPSVPGNVRTALVDTTLPRGGGPKGDEPIFCKKGTPVGYIVQVMHTRTDFYGPDALEFKPERWSGPPPKPWSYLPFNGGPRICLGQQFAIAEMGYIIVRMAQTFETLEQQDFKERVMRKTIILTSGNGVKVSLCRKSGP